MTPFTKDRPSYHIGLIHVDEIVEEVGPWESTWEENSQAIVCRRCGNVYCKIVVFILRNGAPEQQPFLTVLDTCEECGGGYLERRIHTLRGVEYSWPVGPKILARELTLAIRELEKMKEKEPMNNGTA